MCINVHMIYMCLRRFELDAADMEMIYEARSTALRIAGGCGDEYRRPPYLTAAGDLSDHITDSQQFAAKCLPEYVLYVRLYYIWVVLFVNTAGDLSDHIMDSQQFT